MSTESLETPTEAPEQSDDVSADDGVEATETSTSSESQDDEVAVKLDSIPKELHAQLKPHIDKINKDFKSTYTKKFQELSSKEKQYLAQQQAIVEQYNQLRDVAYDVLRDPSKLDAYRKVYADQLGVAPPTPQEAPAIQTVGDLTNYYDRKLENLASVIEQKVMGRAQETVQRTSAVQRWDSALNRLYTEDPKFKKYERIVATMIKEDPKYRPSADQDEYKSLKKAFTDFKSMLREDLDSIKQETLNSVKAKKKTNTFTPTKPVTTQTQSRSLSVDEIIARVNDRVGGW